jgi:hypothetical protein
MDNPSRMEPARKNSSELTDSLVVTRVDLMNTLREVTDQDFQTNISVEWPEEKPITDSIARLLLQLAYLEKEQIESLKGLSSESPSFDFAEAPQAIHALNGIRWDTLQALDSHSPLVGLEEIVREIVSRESRLTEQIRNRPKTEMPPDIPVLSD